MKSKAKFQKRLTDWYLDHHRKLPWRETKNPYHIWVSEVMLQQTQVKTALPYYQRFIKRFPNLEILARSDVQDVLKLWEGLGYYARARNLHKAAQFIVTEYNGLFPDSRASFRKLPGVGDYIASAVFSIAFDQPFAVVDGNVRRVLARLFELETIIDHASSSAKEFQACADELLVYDTPGQYNQAIMELGAVICKPSVPDCSLCPLCLLCQANLHGTTRIYPRRIKRNPVPLFAVAAGLVFNNGRFLITRRKPEGLLGGLWEIPGGKIKIGENPQDACARELLEETGLVVQVKDCLVQVKHAYTHFKIVMDVFRCEYISGDIRLDGPTDYRWIGFGNIDEYPFPKADLKSFAIIKKQFDEFRV